ncbi:MAG: enoyl-CoA hydratase/isomerase family protein [Gemmatimonadales bacterium]
MRVHVDVTRPLATVHLEDGDRHDALDVAAWRALAEAFDRVSARSDVACVILRGMGVGAFSPGVDASSPGARRHSTEDARADADAMAHAFRRVRACPHPTVAIIEGLCLGGGLEIAACCDLRVCGESSRFGAPIAWASPSDEPGPLAQLLGASPILDVMSSGELIDAGRARVVGLVNRVHPDRAVVEQGYGLAARIAAGAPLVNRWHKKVVQRLFERAPVPGTG